MLGSPSISPAVIWIFGDERFELQVKCLKGRLTGSAIISFFERYMMENGILIETMQIYETLA